MNTTLATIANAVAYGREAEAKAKVVPAVAARYPMLAKHIAAARDCYLTGAEAAGLPTEKLPEITTLGRLMREWLDGIADTNIVSIAISAGFPAHLTPMVKVSSLRAWLTLPAYGGNDPKLGRILDKAREVYAEAYPDLAGPCEDCGAEPGDCNPVICLADASLDDEVPTLAEIVEDPNTPAEWLNLDPDAIRALARHMVEMNAYNRLAIEAGASAA
ncbi:hypothetical protein [Planomonospora sp. ID82291]|uniref:hypothetical protein n=1 Tax=Planomonospora sp. ID82291 TaxID=2738136 RepID=UPI0018C36959|nr:hypothetical protein [Planomonospora sp. ID82291]MBG0818917.1 hypothetical protein [Planomonospora sp. ID82291]